ncbi:hypothetical protein Anas_00187 [Armadillidium nasatum]|uniref:Uncharacterized protein n=1 Tax=Armadillidium nasatum TaxID=96803 RepID=A0A5N5TH12_9CRUS|nr:hypothetical protein Anas_00187 [Armadillidium nasatum]
MEKNICVEKTEKDEVSYSASFPHHQNTQSLQLKIGNEDHTGMSHISNTHLEEDGGNDADEEEDKNQIVQRSFMESAKDPTSYPLSPQGWQNLNNTIQLVVKTCEALWQQLEEERLTRQRLHFQLQEQRSIITTLTAELLQIQEHQELILKELHASRSSSSSAPYQSSRAYPYDFSQQRMQQEQQPRFQTPIAKNHPVSRLMSDRLPSRTLAYSDSSIDAKQQRKNTGDAESLGYASRSFLSSDNSYRLSHQGKSKSVTQLNTEHDLQDSIQDSMRYNSSGIDFNGPL